MSGGPMPVWCLVILLAGCKHESASGVPIQVGAPEGECSDLTRAVARWQGQEVQACGESGLEFRTLIPLGDSLMLAWTPLTGVSDLWQLKDDGSFGEGPVDVHTFGTIRNNELLVGLGDQRVLEYDQRTGAAIVWGLNTRARGYADPLSPRRLAQTWPRSPGGRGLTALESGVVLDWELSTGRYDVVRYRDDEPAFERFAQLGGNDWFRRGHRLLGLGANRLLTWDLRTREYRIWRYDLGRLPGDIFDSEFASGTWPDLSPSNELLVVAPGKIGIWNRDAGTLELRAFNPLSEDPLLGAPQLAATQDDRFRSILPSRETSTLSNIRRLVIVFQHGRSFDTDFGHYCRAPAASKPDCAEGPDCCETTPELVDGASCRALDDASRDYVPNGSGACQVSKLEAWAQDRLSVPPDCGTSLDFACLTPSGAFATDTFASDTPAPDASESDAPGTVDAYYSLAREGALADHYFASVAESAELNMIYFGTGGFRDPNSLENTRKVVTFVGSALAAAKVPWSLYLSNPYDTFGQGPPNYYDASWGFYRALDELSYDIKSEQLPPLSVVVSATDPKDPSNSLAFATDIARSIQNSERYAPETLVILSHLTSGGFYDHLVPPAPPASDPSKIPYGARVPFLALGPFVRRNHVAHTELEHCSLTAFIEWNWLGGVTGQLGGRDRFAKNLGSLLDASATGVAVPEEAPDSAGP